MLKNSSAWGSNSRISGYSAASAIGSLAITEGRYNAEQIPIRPERKISSAYAVTQPGRRYSEDEPSGARLRAGVAAAVEDCAAAAFFGNSILQK